MRSSNSRIKDIKFGGLYEIFTKANALEEEGKRIIHMEIGRPDFDSPEMAKKAVKKALDNEHVHYTDINGIRPLREAIINKEKRRFGLEYDSETEITVTAGACEALSAILLAYMDAGEELLCTSPFFSAYSEMALITGVKLVEVPVYIDNNWKLDINEIRKRITSKTKMLLINSPNNPTGYVLSKEELQLIADIAIENDLVVISDECYDEFNYEGEHVSISTLPNMKERTLVVKSTSKSFSMTGWRIGYVLGPDHMIRYINKVHQNLSTCATAFAQYGAVEAFNNGDKYIENMVTEFKRRGDRFYEDLSKIKGLQIVKPEGAFYMFPKITSFGLSDVEVAEYLLEEVGVVGVPGSSFGEFGKGHIRLAYSRSYEDIVEAGEKLKFAFDKLRKR
ncbi:pyridoxal phosphate-dependent aminotransferase [Anaerosalibacter bizertensis]|uniref:Aminotransferase n=1 Tax=Anaerosalibacter bizertensis TaxID=932217 RepID=A0A844FIX5_9FIRM|nr:pyridoxal phosphate-dependent aminotransferase [Anaerosalibacter bizertensis]MSS44063.1 pyridoxal phosphate-dependent aminotransferase [Anaerosalibacter bizertensis]